MLRTILHCREPKDPEKWPAYAQDLEIRRWSIGRDACQVDRPEEPLGFSAIPGNRKLCGRMANHAVGPTKARTAALADTA